MPFSPPRRSLCAALAVISSLALGSAGSSARATAASTRNPVVCGTNVVRVSTAAGRPADEHIATKLCVPAGRRLSTVQVLVNGFTYGPVYWNFPDPRGKTDRYSYVAAATRAGYATLSYDQLGTGASSHPPTTAVTAQAHAWILHQMITELRQGSLSGPTGRVRAAKVVTVPHSYGGIVAEAEASKYHDVDAMIVTGLTHHLRYDNVATKLTISLIPAGLDKKFRKLLLNPSYLTTRPGTRYRSFYAPGRTDSKVIAYDEATKNTGTAVEMATGVASLIQPADVRVPVLLVLGRHDGLNCGLSATDCTSAATVMKSERPWLGSHLPCLNAYILPGAGHVINLMPNARQWFTVSQRWLGEAMAGRPEACA